MTQDALNAATGVPTSTIKKYEGSHSEPSAGHLASFAKAGINLHWLLTGAGDMLMQQPHAVQQPVAAYGAPHGPTVDALLLEKVIAWFYAWLDAHRDQVRIDRDRHAAVIAVLYRVCALSGRVDDQELQQVMRAAA